MELKKGIDISRYQGNIDWNAVKNAGYEFAIVRISTAFNGLHLDTTAMKNVEGAKEAGLILAGYHYALFQNIEKARQEADYFKSIIKDLNLRFAALDLEDDSLVGDLTDASLAFLDIIQSVTQPVFYSYPSYIQSHFNSKITRYPLWIAHYGVSSPRTVLWQDWQIWQQRSNGIVPGINGNVDIDVMKADFIKGDADMLKTIVVYEGDIDAFSAVLVSQKLKCPMIKRTDFDASGIIAEQVVQIGGKSGTDRFDSFKDAAKLV